MLKLIKLAVVVWFILRVTLLFLAWTGDKSPERRAQVLEHFSEEDIVSGREYALNAFFPRAAAGFIVFGFVLVMLSSGTYSSIWKDIQEWTNGGFWLPSILFALFFMLTIQVITLPFSFYSGHICEVRAGFSNMTALQWIQRFVKAVLTSWTFQTIGVMMILSLFRWMPDRWPVALPFAVTAFSTASILLFPIVVTPLFFTQSPLNQGSLRSKIQGIADSVGVDVENIYQIDASRYSKHTNAYFTGVFGRKRIVLYDTLINSHTEDEVALVFAHEAGHWLHDHMRKGLIFGFLGTLAASLALWFFFPHLQSESSLSLEPLHSAGNIPFFYAALIVLNLFFSPIEAQISQHFERQADASAIELTGMNQTFIDAKVRMGKDNRSELLPHPFRVFWLYSHPPIIDRISKAKKSPE